MQPDGDHPARPTFPAPVLDVADRGERGADLASDGRQAPTPGFQVGNFAFPDGLLVHGVDYGIQEPRCQWDAIARLRDAHVMTVGDRIKAARALRGGMTRPELARLSGVPYPTLAGLENGDQRTSTALPALAEALQVNAYWLQTGKGPRDSEAPGHTSHSARPDFRIIAGAIAVLQHYLEVMGEPPEWLKDPALLGIAYDVVATLGGDDVPDNVLDLTKHLAQRVRDSGGLDAEEVRGTG